jgi:RluA family pseudouridine synthase
MTEKQIWVVPASAAGMKLQTFLQQQLPSHYSLRQLKKAIEENCCQVNGRTERFASFLVGEGDTLLLHPIKLVKEAKIVFEAPRLLYEDASLLIYNKPARTPSDSEALLNALQSHSPQLRLIHRLDRDTTGVLLFAKNEMAFVQMVEIFKQQRIDKKYLAIVEGIPHHRSGKVSNYLGEKRRYQGQTVWGSVPKSQGVAAVTEWRVAQSGNHSALLECFPKTGRTHQIRVHLSEMGHPLLGDYQYGRTFESPFRPSRYLLHAQRVRFVTQKGIEIEVEAPLPKDFHEAMGEL